MLFDDRIYVFFGFDCQLVLAGSICAWRLAVATLLDGSDAPAFHVRTGKLA